MSNLIDRQVAIDALGEEPMVWTDSDYEIAQRNQWNLDKLAIETVPTAEPKKGKWEQIEINYFADMENEIKESMAIASMYCPVCKRYHNEVYLYGDATHGANYCPWCGADMRGEE